VRLRVCVRLGVPCIGIGVCVFVWLGIGVYVRLGIGVCVFGSVSVCVFGSAGRRNDGDARRL